MGGTVDWGMVEGGVIAFLAIMLLLAPVFWWMYDTDRAMKFGDRFREMAVLAFVLIPNALRLLAKHDWFWLTVECAAIGVTVWGVYRAYRPKRDISLG